MERRRNTSDWNKINGEKLKIEKLSPQNRWGNGENSSRLSEQLFSSEKLMMSLQNIWKSISWVLQSFDSL